MGYASFTKADRHGSWLPHAGGLRAQQVRTQLPSQPMTTQRETKSHEKRSCEQTSARCRANFAGSMPSSTSCTECSIKYCSNAQSCHANLGELAIAQMVAVLHKRGVPPTPTPQWFRFLLSGRLDVVGEGPHPLREVFVAVDQPVCRARRRKMGKRGSSLPSADAATGVTKSFMWREGGSETVEQGLFVP